MEGNGEWLIVLIWFLQVADANMDLGLQDVDWG